MKKIAILCCVLILNNLSAQIFNKHQLTNFSTGTVDFDLSDFNEDNRLDVLSLSTNVNNNLGWFKNNLNNQFSYHGIDSNLSFSRIETNFITNTDTVDVVAYSEVDSSLYFYLWSSSALINHTIIPLNQSILDFYIDDLNNDSLSDYVFLSGLNELTLMVSNGVLYDTISVSHQLSSIDDLKIKDIESDSDLDLVVLSKQSKQVSVIENKGVLGFVESVLPTDTLQTPLCFDFYKHPDSLYHNVYIAYEFYDSIECLSRIDSSSFSSRFIKGLDAEISQINVSDFNNDSIADFIYYSSLNDKLIYANHSNNQVNSKVFLDQNLMSCDKILSKDIDFDNDMDVVVLSGESGQISVFLKEADGFKRKTISKQTIIPRTWFTDVDGDSDLDIVVLDKKDTTKFANITEHSIKELGVFENDGIGNFDYHHLIDGYIAFKNGYVQPRTITNDQDQDIYYMSGYRLHFLQNIADLESFIPYSPYQSGLYSFNRTVHIDWDNDGDEDIYCFRKNSLVLYRNIGDHDYDPQGGYSTPLSVGNPTSIGVFDFNNDGKKDVIYSDGEEIFGFRCLYDSISDKLYKSVDGRLSSINQLGHHDYFHVFDFNQDGYDDILSKHRDSLFFYKNTGDGTFLEKEYLVFPEGSKIPSTFYSGTLQIADFDLDNDMDFVFITYDYSDSTTSLNLFLNNGVNRFVNYYVDSFFEDGYVYSSDGSIGHPVYLSRNFYTADFDEDGDLDLMGRSNNNIVWYENDICMTSSQVFDTVCDVRVSPSGIDVWNESGIYTEIIENSNGCDSIITFHLEVAKSYNEIEVETCDSYDTPSGKHLTTSGNYLDTITNVLGCDSVIRIDLRINNNTSEISVEACENYNSPSGNYIWSESGLYADTLTNRFNCDSIIHIDLEVLTLVNMLEYKDSLIQLIEPTIAETFSWVNCNTNESIEGENSVSFQPVYDGNYALVLFYNNCLFRTECISIDLNYIHLNYIGFNKESNRLKLQFDNYAKDVKVTVYDVLGKLISYSSHKEIIETEIQKNMHSGLYLVIVEYDGFVEKYKVVKK